MQHIWRKKDAYTCEHPVRMTEADDKSGWRVRMTCEHRLKGLEVACIVMTDCFSQKNIYQFYLTVTECIQIIKTYEKDQPGQWRPHRQGNRRWHILPEIATTIIRLQYGMVTWWMFYKLNMHVKYKMNHGQFSVRTFLRSLFVAPRTILRS